MNKTKKALKRIRFVKKIGALSILAGFIGLMYLAGTMEADSSNLSLMAYVPEMLLCGALTGAGCGIVYKIEAYEDMLHERLEKLQSRYARASRF